MPTCQYCGFGPLRNKTYIRCSAPECKKARHRDRAREFQRRARAEYAARGESYRARWGWASYGSSRRRAMVNSPDADVITRGALGDRDGWNCGLCARPVDPSVSYPDPLSASVDHVLPLSRGGTHTWGNVQIAHNRCNVSKKANVEWRPEVAA